MEAIGYRLAMIAMIRHGTLVRLRLLPGYQTALLASGDAVILFGDYNCKNPRWSCPVANYSENILERLEEKLAFKIIAPSTLTYYPAIPLIDFPCWTLPARRCEFQPIKKALQKKWRVGSAVSWKAVTGSPGAVRQHTGVPTARDMP
ncbi:hypothetical protein EVAR_20345_1 [Eumeta japonica]|uniref:Endonuclease/exonuclease/phosphatase domain-containing protein n=1 Tax=Eumeta variegata TaxID=151549 RepID=A0A4C1VTL4_EUMVA|nr:hypothetical protein EVAR_20345_1 [Eumeta japonica]